MTTETAKNLITTPVRARDPSESTEVAMPNRDPAAMMVLAIQHNADPEVLQKLLDVQERWESNQARKAYVEAMTEFKKECPAVLNRDATVDFASSGGRTRYRHATLGGITEAITPTLSKHGLSASFETKQDKGTVSVTCNITHRAGHRESTTLIGPEDKSGNKNMIQAVGSAVTYLQRYTLLSALGLATADQDDDGFAAEVAERRAKAATAAGDILNKKRGDAPQSTPAAPAAQPQPDPARGEENQAPAGTEVASGKIEEVTKKPGGTREKPWLRYGVKMNGIVYGTFSQSHGELAEKAFADGAEVDIEWAKEGKYTNLLGIRISGGGDLFT